MNYTEVEAQQAEILKRISACKEVVEPFSEVTGILKVIREAKEADVKSAMSDFGVRLSLFAEHIDLAHPDLHNIFEGTLVGSGSFSDIACDVLKLAVYGNAEHVSYHVISKLQEACVQHHLYTNLDRAIDSPQENQLHARFVKDQSIRNKIRESKSFSPIGVSSLAKSGIGHWNSIIPSFESYYRFESRFKKDMDEALARKSFMEEYGLHSMAIEVQNTIDEMKAIEAKSSYYGFNRITLTTAATILAKICGYEYEDHPYIPLYGNAEIFKSCQSFQDNFKEELEKSSKVTYAPRLYPIHMMTYMCSSARKLLDHLESFPDANGKPLFDHYRVLIPGANHPQNQFQFSYNIKYPDGSDSWVSDFWRVQSFLDNQLVVSKCLPAVLLGERDGEHYFISYFLNE